MAGGIAESGYTTKAGYAGEYGNVAEYGTPNSAYAAPSFRQDAPYNDEFGWTADTRISVASTPDAMRTMSAPVRDVRPNASLHPSAHYGPIYQADEQPRHSVEDQDADGWRELKDQYKIGPDPRWNPPNETRWTEQLSPRSYSFTRPFDQGRKGNGARQLNGQHFSMADHRRDFEILGMQPWHQRRNTYRVDPAPWDADMYDVPPESTIGTTSYGRVQAVDIPGDYGNRSYRL